MKERGEKAKQVIPFRYSVVEAVDWLKSASQLCRPPESIDLIIQEEGGELISGEQLLFRLLKYGISAVAYLIEKKHNLIESCEDRILRLYAGRATIVSLQRAEENLLNVKLVLQSFQSEDERKRVLDNRVGDVKTLREFLDRLTEKNNFQMAEATEDPQHPFAQEAI